MKLHRFIITAQIKMKAGFGSIESMIPWRQAGNSPACPHPHAEAVLNAGQAAKSLLTGPHSCVIYTENSYQPSAVSVRKI